MPQRQDDCNVERSTESFSLVLSEHSRAGATGTRCNTRLRDTDSSTACSPHAALAQWQSTGLVNQGSWVQISQVASFFFSNTHFRFIWLRSKCYLYKWLNVTSRHVTSRQSVQSRLSRIVWRSVNLSVLDFTVNSDLKQYNGAYNIYIYIYISSG